MDHKSRSLVSLSLSWECNVLSSLGALQVTLASTAKGKKKKKSTLYPCISALLHLPHSNTHTAKRQDLGTYRCATAEIQLPKIRGLLARKTASSPASITTHTICCNVKSPHTSREQRKTKISACPPPGMSQQEGFTQTGAAGLSALLPQQRENWAIGASVTCPSSSFWDFSPHPNKIREF